MADAGRILLLIKGEYQPDTLYRKMDVTLYKKSSYVCKEDCIGVSPEDQEKWQILAEGAGSKAEDILFADKFETGADNVQDALEAAIEKAESAFLSASNGKKAIAAAVAGKGQSASEGESFSSLAEKIRNISEDATAREADTLSGKTFYSGGVKRTGSIPSKGTATYTPTTENQTIAAGQYLSGAQTISAVPTESKTITAGTGVTMVQPSYGKYLDLVVVNPTPSQEKTCTPQRVSQTMTPDSGKVLKKVTVNGDNNLVPENIRNGISIFGVSGKLGGIEKRNSVLYYQRYDFGAESNGTYALLAGGRGAGNELLTGVETLNENLTNGRAEGLSEARAMPASGYIGGYIVFGAGRNTRVWGTNTVDAYGQNLEKVTVTTLSEIKSGVTAAKTEKHLLFAGGYSAGRRGSVDAYDGSLVRNTAASLEIARDSMAGGEIGGAAFFGGGFTNEGKVSDKTEFYRQNLTKGTAGALGVARMEAAAVKISRYLLIAGGNLNVNGVSAVDAYDKNLVRSTPTALSLSLYRPTGTELEGRALIYGEESEIVNVYHENLTRSTFSLSKKRSDFKAVSVAGKAIFAGGKSYGEVLSDIETLSIIK